VKGVELAFDDTRITSDMIYSCLVVILDLQISTWIKSALKILQVISALLLPTGRYNLIDPKTNKVTQTPREIRELANFVYSMLANKRIALSPNEIRKIYSLKDMVATSGYVEVVENSQRKTAMQAVFRV
jgi:hypothetical protein